MDVVLIRSAEVDESIIDEVLGLLQAVPGPLHFEGHPGHVTFQAEELEPFKEDDPTLKTQKIVSSRQAQYVDNISMSMRLDFDRIKPLHTAQWELIFSKIEIFRAEHSIPAEKHIILLTDHHNVNNWFSSFDPGMKLNYFIQTSLWHEFIDGGRRFPVAYESMALVLQRLMSRDFDETVYFAHRYPKGCMNDFCINKEQIALKLRTADICSDCLITIRNKGISQTLILQALATFDSIRKQMLFSQHYIATQKPSRLSISGDKLDIRLLDLDNTRLNFNPLQKVVYLFFLKHPEGIALVDFSDYYDELMSIYRKVSNAESEESMQASIQALCNPLDNSLNEKISRIRRIIRDVLGDELGSQYQITGPSGGKRKIPLDQDFIVWEG